MRDPLPDPLGIRCRYCGVEPGARCVSKGRERPGGVERSPHALRLADATHGLDPDVDEIEPLADVVDLAQARQLRRARKNGYTG